MTGGITAHEAHLQKPARGMIVDQGHGLHGGIQRRKVSVGIPFPDLAGVHQVPAASADPALMDLTLPLADRTDHELTLEPPGGNIVELGDGFPP